MGTAFDAWYPGYIDYAPDLQEHRGVLDRDRALLSTRRRTSTRSTTFRRTCATCGRRASIRARGSRDGGACATRSTTWKRHRSRVIEYAAKYKESLLMNRYSAGRDQIARGANEGAVRVRRSAGSARSRRRRRTAAPPRLRRRARVAADGAGDDRRRVVSGRHVGRADRPGVRRDGARGARRPALSRSAAVSRRAARAAVRRGRLDAAAADGRPRRGGGHAARRTSPRRR